MRIVYCKDNLGNSAGMERVLCTKANYFADVEEYDVHIVVAEKLPDDLFFKFSSKIRFHSLSLDTSNKKPTDYIFNSTNSKLYKQRLTMKLKELQPDIVVSMFGSEYDFLYKINDGSIKVLEFHFSRNYLTHLIEGLPNSRKRLLKKIWVQFLQWRERYYSRRYEHIVLLTEKDKQLWGGGDKFVVIPNPLSFISEEKSSLESKQMVAMGRYIAQKGFDLLIDAFNMVVADFPDWKVYIIGEGQDKDFLLRKINDLSLQNNVFLKEPVTNVEKELLEASVFLFPSRYEGFGLVLTEAMTCGVPCIAFDCECGPSEIIADSTDGFLVEPNNVPDLAAKMKLLMSDISLRKKMGQLSGLNVLRFSEFRIMGLWVEFFNRLINK